MNAWRKGCRRAGFVMVFQKAGQFLLVIKPCIEVLSYCSSLTSAQSIVQSFVIGKIKSLLLERPFQIPVDLGHKAELRVPLAHSPRCLGPEGPTSNTPSSL